jgi:hypothetical protein
MNISRADAIAHLAKWYDAGTTIRATYRELSASAIKVSGSGCEILLYFRNTSDYDYNDNREPENQAIRPRKNKYPTIIKVKFSGGDYLEVHEFFDDERRSHD